ncbi:Serpentine Receptor, class H [Caenorhabditis elegans]|uniref:Serpentine Receptor, class H n=1 Tax=Caenorhabditis elegans TaxID=6239 RepID=G5EBP3_CAEEL|nr:Serpentine Receptor, class H [Caenorhabditis elegans]CAB03195.2 Serpentine Receptor, class H [Caenorhabditis elegans]|eukprot:NP_506962.2 Serpentine Receptor, class H [Caenorhabditis elegans]
MVSSIIKFIGSPRGYSTIFYVISGISFPIHLFGSYCILFQTSATMKSVKWTLFNLHFWSAALDLSISFLAQPFFCTPTMAAFPLGVLSLIGVPNDLLMLSIYTIFMLVPVSIISMFENRYFVLFVNRGCWRYFRYPFLVANYIIVITYCFIIYLEIPDQEIAIKKLFKKYPRFYNFEIPVSSFIVISDEDRSWQKLRRISVISFILLEIIVFGILLRVKLKLSMKKIASSISSKTLQMQKRFIKALNLQIAIPLIVIFVPIIAGMIFKALSIVNPQAFSNLLNFYFSLHGVLSTILMLYLQNPYREAVLSIFCCRKPVESKIFTTAGKFSRKSMT